MKTAKFSQMDWNEQQECMENVDSDTPIALVVQILEYCCQSLNHEDENYVPAIKEAIRRLNIYRVDK